MTSLHAFDEIEEDLLDDVDLDNVPEPETAPEWSGDSDGSEGGEGFDGGTAEAEQAAESTPSVAAEPAESMDTIDTVELSPGASSSQREHQRRCLLFPGSGFLVTAAPVFIAR